MATKSFLKNVNLHSTRECQAFIRALEKSVDTPVRNRQQPDTAKAFDMDKEAIQKIFSSKDAKNDRIQTGEPERID